MPFIPATMSAQPVGAGAYTRDEHDRRGRHAAESRAAPLPEARDRAAPDAAAPRPRRRGDRGGAQRPRRPRAAARLQRGGAGGGPRDAARAHGLRGGGARRLRPPRALPVLGRRPAVPALGLAGAVARGLRRAHADHALGRGAHRRPQLPLGERVRVRGPRRPALAHGAVRGAARGGQRRPLRGARSCGSRRRCAAAARRAKPSAPRCVREWPSGCSGTRRPSACWSPRSRRARAACATCTPCSGWPTPATASAASPRSRAPACSTPPDVTALRAGLRLPAARAQRGALRHRPPDRPADASTCTASWRRGSATGRAAGLLASELLMRDYYRRASRLHEVCRAFVEIRSSSRSRAAACFAALRLRRAPTRARR